MPDIATVTDDAVTALAAALGLDAEQTEVMRGLVSRTDLLDTPRIARLFGFEDQTIRAYRKNRNVKLDNGIPLGPKDFIAPVNKAGQSPEYVAGQVYLWGMQTRRLLWNGEVNKDRKLPGRHVGKLPRARESKDFTEQRKAVVAAYRRKRRAGKSDDEARTELVAELGLSRQVVARRILEAERDQGGPLWADSPQPANVS